MNKKDMREVHDCAMDMMRDRFSRIPLKDLAVISDLKSCFASAHMAGFHASNLADRLRDADRIANMKPLEEVQ